MLLEFWWALFDPLSSEPPAPPDLAAGQGAGGYKIVLVFDAFLVNIFEYCRCDLTGTLLGELRVPSVGS